MASNPATDSSTHRKNMSDRPPRANEKCLRKGLSLLCNAFLLWSNMLSSYPAHMIGSCRVVRRPGRGFHAAGASIGRFGGDMARRSIS